MEPRYLAGFTATDSITTGLRGTFVVVEKAVVLDVDEELSARRMRVRRARHRNGSQFVFQARLEGESGLVFYWSTGRLLAHSRLEPAALNHKTVDDAVKYGAIVETALGVLKKIRDRLGSLVGIELERKTAHIGLEFNARILRPSDRDGEKEGGQRDNAFERQIDQRLRIVFAHGSTLSLSLRR